MALEHLRRTGRPRDRGADPAVHELRGRRGSRRRARLPVRHRLGHGLVVAGTPGDSGRQLPQRHAARVLRGVGQRDGAPSAAGAAGAARARPAGGARPGRLVLQRGGAAPGGLRADRRRAARRHGARRGGGGGAGGRRGRAAPAGSVSAGSPRTRGSSTRSWRCWWPGGTTTKRRRSTVVGRPMVASYTSALLRFVDELGLRDAVTFTGPLSDSDLVGAMEASDLFVLTSRHEGFGVPVLEAMTLGLPVVANADGRPARNRRRRWCARRRHGPVRDRGRGGRAGGRPGPLPRPGPGGPGATRGSRPGGCRRSCRRSDRRARLLTAAVPPRGPARNPGQAQTTLDFAAAARTAAPSTVTLVSTRSAAGRPTKISSGPSGGRG